MAPAPKLSDMSAGMVTSEFALSSVLESCTLLMSTHGSRRSISASGGTR